jgi:hypothetical protein
MTEPSAAAADDTPLSDRDLRALLVRARTLADPQFVRLVTSYVTLRRVTADVIAGIEARDGGAAVAKSPLLRRARALSARDSSPGAT